MKNRAIWWPFAGAVGTITVALFGLLGYRSGLRILGSGGAEYIPMAPSTAVGFLLLGGVLLLLRHLKKFPLPAAFVVFSVALFGALEVAGYYTGTDLNLEERLVPAMGTLNGIPIGLMSPATGLLFFLCGAALLLLLRRQNSTAPTAWTDYLLSLLYVLILLITFLFFLAYLYGTPLLYGDQKTIPMALTTVTGFLFLTFSLITTARDIRPLCQLCGASTRSHLLRFMLPLAVVSAVFGGIAVLYSTHAGGINPAFLSAAVTVMAALIAGGAAALISRNLGIKIDRAENDLKQANDALKQTGRKYRELVESINDWIWEIGADGRYTYVSPRSRELLGYEPHELIGRSPFDLMPQDEAEKISALLSDAIARKIPVYNFLNRNLHKNGREIILESSAKPLLSAEGELLGFRGIDRDVTERIQAESRLREEQTRLELYLQTAQVILFALDLDGTITMINPKGCEVLGYTHHELIGKNWFECCIPEISRNEIKKVFERCRQPRDKVVSAYENEILRKDGTRRLIQWHNAQLFDSTGAVIGVLSSGEDITEYRQAQDMLIASRDLLRSVVENTPSRIFWKDAQLRYLGCNTAFARDAGMSAPQELLGKDDFQMGWRDQAELYRTDDLSVIESGRPKIGYEEPQTTPDGNQIWLRTSKVPLRGADGNIFGILGVYDDITEHKKAEERLKLFRTLLDHSSEAVEVLEPSTLRFLDVNETECRTLGYSREELLSMSVFDIDPEFTPERSKAVEEQIRQKGNLRLEGIHRHRNGSTFPVEISVTLVELDRPYILSIARDITERKEAESVLQESEERHRLLFESSRDALMTSAPPSWTFTSANAAALKLFGITGVAEFCTLGPWDLSPVLQPDGSPSAEKVREMIAAAMEEGSKSFEWEHRRIDGGLFPADVMLTRIKLGEQLSVLATVRDISQRKQMEATLKQKEELMIAQSRQAAMGEMIAMIAHQWRQPITVIAMAANNIKLDIELEEEVTDSTLLKMIDTVTEQTQHLSKTIDDFRDFFKPNREKETTTIAGVLEGTMKIIGKSLENNNIAVTIEDQSTCRLLTYPNELLQVFLNILNNAKDVFKTHTRRDARIIITIYETETEVVTAICDNGGGIPDNVINHISEPYFTTKQQQGTGLGIYMSKTIVEQHLEGRFTWANHDTIGGRGACFTVTLPREPGGKEPL